MRSEIILTSEWQLLSSTTCIITVKSGTGTISFNETATDVAALSYNTESGQQFSQGDEKDTYARLITGVVEVVVVEGG